MAEQPTESEIKQIFKRLISIPTNKQCFDCGNSNPTWASVTYGVFLCIDCSAVHRSLGVHVTFIRSTVLDTSWTWLQLRAMQVGGNGHAKSFFNQHGVITNDAPKKYHSRAANLYRDKLVSLAQHANRLHGTKPVFEEKGKAVQTGQLHIESNNDPSSPEPKEVDFFSEHAHDSFPATTSLTPIADSAKLGGGDTKPPPSSVNGKAADVDPTAGPNVEAALSTSPTQAMMQAEPRKAIIGAKKAPAGRKGKGLGAQRVKKDFNEIESRAQQVDKEKEEIAKNTAIQESKTAEEQEKQMTNMRLAYQDMSLQRKKEEEKLMRNDPKKAAQFERLGMGFAGNKGISHSAISDMQTIQQESPSSGGSGRSRDFDSYGEKPKSRSRDFFDDEFELVSSSSSSKRTGDSFFNDYSSGWGNKNRSGGWDLEFEDKSSMDSRTPSAKQEDSVLDSNEVSGEDNAEESVENGFEPSRSRKAADSLSSSSGSSSLDAQKKFGNAKSISSDQYFGNNRDNDFEVRANLARLEGSNSISSDDYFGRSSTRRAPTYNSNAPDLQEIKDGVKQGVTKVAGKISSLANGVMSSLQDRYG